MLSLPQRLQAIAIQAADLIEAKARDCRWTDQEALAIFLRAMRWPYAGKSLNLTDEMIDEQIYTAEGGEGDFDSLAKLVVNKP